MNNYLDNYGVVDARRDQRWKRILYSLLTIAVVGGALWFFLRNFKEESRVRKALLRRTPALACDADFCFFCLPSRRTDAEQRSS